MKPWYVAALITYHIRRAFERVVPLEHPVSATVSKRWGYLTSRIELQEKGTVASISITVRVWHPGFWWLAAGWLMDGDNDGGTPLDIPEMARRAAAQGVA